MLSLMLDPRFKSFRLVSSFLGREEGVNIVDEYDKKNFVSYAFKVLSSFASNDRIRWCVNQTCDKNSSLNIFQQIVSTSEPSKELVQGIIDSQMLPSGSQRHQVSLSMVEKIWNHVSYNWFFGSSNLRHYRLQIETKRIFF